MSTEHDAGPSIKQPVAPTEPARARSSEAGLAEKGLAENGFSEAGSAEAGLAGAGSVKAEEGVYMSDLRASRRRDQPQEPNAGRKGLFLVLGLAMVVAGVVALVLGGMQEKGIYAKQVDALLQERGKFQGKAVRAEGNLVHGTLVRRVSPCEYRFTIEKNGTSMPVRFADCVVPDTFRDVPGMDLAVTVEGKLLADNSFEATNVLAKCPSKYEMKQRQGQGEAMPHSLSGNGLSEDGVRNTAKSTPSAQPM